MREDEGGRGRGRKREEEGGRGSKRELGLKGYKLARAERRLLFCPRRSALSGFVRSLFVFIYSRLFVQLVTRQFLLDNKYHPHRRLI